MHIATPQPTTPSRLNDLPGIPRVDDALWAQLAPRLAIHKPRKKSGRPRCDDRAIVDGLLWLAYTGAGWSELPAAFGSKSTCHKRLQEWIERGVFAQAWALLLTAYDDLAALNWSWQASVGMNSAATPERKGLWAPRKRPGALNSAEQASGDPLPHNARSRAIFVAA